MNNGFSVADEENHEGFSGDSGKDPIRFAWNDYRGEGESAGFSRGILAYSGDLNLTGEGMGIGSIAIRKGKYTYFPSRHTTLAAGDGAIERTFYLDTWRKWAWRGHPSLHLTRFMGSAASCYMAVPMFQSLIFIRSPLYRALSIHPVSVQIPPVAKARFRYVFMNGSITVSCTIRSCEDTLSRIFILNELDGDLFCRSLRHGIIEPPPSGWRKCPDASSGLCSPRQNICFRMSDVVLEGDATYRSYWGREHTDSLRWAGFEIMIDPCSGAREITCSYVVRIGRYRNEGGTG